MTTLQTTIDSLAFQNERHIHIQYRMEDEVMWVKSRLSDDHHDIHLYWKIDIPTHSIAEVEGRMDDKPFDDCGTSLKILKAIQGLEIGLGVKKNFRNRFPKDEGCTHITELSLATFDFVIARLYGPKSRPMTEDQRQKCVSQTATFLCKNNSCTVFNQKKMPHFDEKGRYKGKEYDY